MQGKLDRVRDALKQKTKDMANTEIEIKLNCLSDIVCYFDDFVRMTDEEMIEKIKKIKIHKIELPDYVDSFLVKDNSVYNSSI